MVVKNPGLTKIAKFDPGDRRSHELPTEDPSDHLYPGKADRVEK
jgi:hypothetical protein